MRNMNRFTVIIEWLDGLSAPIHVFGRTAAEGVSHYVADNGLVDEYVNFTEVDDLDYEW